MARVTCKKARRYCGCTNHVCRRLSFGAKVDQAFDSDSVKLVMEIPRTNEREALNHREPNQSAKPVNGISTRKWHSSASGSPYFDNFLITTEWRIHEARNAEVLSFAVLTLTIPPMCVADSNFMTFIAEFIFQPRIS